MSNSEKFVARWSRLKREKVQENEKPQAGPKAASPGPNATAAPEQPAENLRDAGQPPQHETFDLASLPPIESITAATDIKAFLQAGVPADLARAALRRVWTTDPAIRDFIGLAENQWDFTDPTAMPGFGPLDATDDVRQLVSQAMGKLGQLSEPPAIEQASVESSPASEPLDAPACTPASPQAAGMPEENAPLHPGVDAEDGQHTIKVAASQHADAAAESIETPNRRTHGGALPK